MSQESPSNQDVARDLLRAGGAASLATLAADGMPFASYVITAPSTGGAPVMLISALAEHTKNLKRDPRASLLFVREPDAGAERMTALRLTVTGRCVKDDAPQARRSFLERHPDSSRYADFADFAFYRFEISAGHLVAGFGRIVDLSREELLDLSEPSSSHGSAVGPIP